MAKAALPARLLEAAGSPSGTPETQNDPLTAKMNVFKGLVPTARGSSDTQKVR